MCRAVWMQAMLGLRWRVVAERCQACAITVLLRCHHSARVQGLGLEEALVHQVPVRLASSCGPTHTARAPTGRPFS